MNESAHPYKIVIVPDSFKGSLSSSQAASAIERGVHKVLPEASVVKIPMADGGEGTVEAMIAALGGRIVPVEVGGPMGHAVDAFFGILPDGVTGVIEMAASSGLTLVDEAARNPLKATSYGTGELVARAIEAGCTRLYIGVGGSATNDGGMGMAQALGAVFYDASGYILSVGAEQLSRIDRIDVGELKAKIEGVAITVISDVTNPLCGEHGATYVFGPQKGVTVDMLPILDSGLRHYAGKLKSELCFDVLDLPGAGAGGGMGAGLAAFLGADIRRGIDVVSDAADLAGHVVGADLVITGEGRTDRQTAFGKVPAGVAAIAREHNVPVICLSGSLGEGIDELHEIGITACFSIINSPMSLDDAMYNADTLLELSAEQIMRLLNRG